MWTVKEQICSFNSKISTQSLWNELKQRRLNGSTKKKKKKGFSPFLVNHKNTTADIFFFVSLQVDT